MAVPLGAILVGLGIGGKTIYDEVSAHHQQQARQEKVAQYHQKTGKLLGELQAIQTDRNRLSSQSTAQKQIAINQFVQDSETVGKLNLTDYQNYLATQGVATPDDLITKQRQNYQNLFQAETAKQITTAAENRRLATKKQRITNLQEQTKILNLIATKGLQDSSIAAQTWSQIQGEHDQKIINIMLRYNTTYQNALATENQNLQKMMADLDSQAVGLSSQEMTSFLAWKATKRQEKFENMTMQLQHLTSQYQIQNADLQFAITLAQSKLQAAQTEAELI